MYHNIELFKILTVLFCLAMTLKAVSQYRRHRRSARELIAWVVVWGATAAVGINPGMTDAAAEVLGLKSGSNALIFFLLIALIYLSLKNIFMIEIFEGRLSELTRRIALREFENGRKGEDER